MSKQPAAILTRCSWAKGEDYVRYHDEEWGVPVHDDRTLFEFLIHEGAQAGRRHRPKLPRMLGRRAAVHPRRVAQYDRKKTKLLLADPGIVRNRLKIASSIQNAQAFLRVQEEFGSFDRYIWQFVGGKTRVNLWKTRKLPAKTHESDAMSKDLKRRGLNFVGSTICYAFMQAVGMVNDHALDCFRYRQLS